VERGGAKKKKKKKKRKHSKEVAEQEREFYGRIGSLSPEDVENSRSEKKKHR